MKTRSFAIDLFLLTSILFSAGCAATIPSPTATPTATQTPTLTPTAAPTSTPTEIPLPEGSISELQKTLGEKYRLTQGEGDNFVIKGIENLKFSQDGTAQLAYEFQGTTENLTIAFQAISAEDGALQIGPWQYKDAEWTMLTAAAPKTVEDADAFPKLAYLEGHAKEKEIDLTIHKYIQMATAKTAKSEFEDVYVEGEKIDLEIPAGWSSWPGANNGTEFIVFDSGLTSQVIALKQGYANLAVYDQNNQVQDLSIIPTVTMNSDGMILSSLALSDKTNFSRMIDLGLLTVENRTNTLLILPTNATGNEGDFVFANKSLLEFSAINNQLLLSKKVILPEMDILPNKDLIESGFWIIIDNF